MVDFIDTHTGTHGVESICSMLPIAPSTYYTHKAKQRDPSLRSKRAKRDDGLHLEIQRVWDESYDGVYGADKVWRQLNREGHIVARCTVERLMRSMGLRGAVRGRAFTVTTKSDEASSRPPDLVQREFRAERPNQLWVADLSVPQQAAEEMRDDIAICTGLSRSACRSRSQTTASGLGQKLRS